MRATAVLVSFLAVLAGVTGWAATVPHPAAAAVAAVPPPAGQPRVKLAVLLVFDQMRADYLETWRGLFGNRGFKRLQSEGAWFTHCNYPYGTTTTGPGHASILTGTCPDRHGIINNAWYEGGGLVNCAQSPRYRIVPEAPTNPQSDAKAAVKTETKAEAKAKPKEAGCPDRLLAETVGDVLRASHPAAKAFGLSLKDRSAVLPVGKRPTGAYWFEGRFVSSTYYADDVHDWVAKLNKMTADNPQDGANWWFGKDWVPALDRLNYYEWLDPAAGPMRVRTDRELVFRHPNTGGKPRPGNEYYTRLATSPYGNELLLGLAKMCVINEGLGRREAPDLLVVSFSSNDLIGHTYGPDSPEVMDVTVRSDAIVAGLLYYLDELVGRGQYLLAVTADHGICPVPAVAKKCGIHDAEAVKVKEMEADLEAYLAARFGRSPEVKAGTKRTGWIEALGTLPTFPWVYFNPKLIAASGRSRDEVAREAAEFLMHRAPTPASWKGHVERAYTRAELVAGFPPDDTISNQVRRSFYQAPTPEKERSGDVYILLKPYCIPGDDYEKTASKNPGSLGGTTHGSPWAYDTHVPLLVYGPGVAGGVHPEPVTPQAIAAIFSKWLGLRLPDKAEFPVPASLEAR